MAGLPKDMMTLFKKAQEDPSFFVENVVSMTTLWEKQKEIMRSVRDNSRTIVRSCNGAGKTFTTANTVTWFLTTHPQSIVVSTAPTARQVRELLWQEINNIHKNSRYPLGGRCLNVNWTMGAKWFAVGLSTDDPNRFQGFHAEHILGVIDEAAGVEAPIWEGMDAILTSSGAHLLAIGNPTEPSGRFYDAFSSPLYNKIHISAFDTPNFTENRITLDDIKTGSWEKKFKSMVFPALITPKWAAERLQEWGEDSPAFQSRILGSFPIMGADTMIPLGWAMRAKERDCKWDDSDRCTMAVDVARFGDDESVIGIRRGNSVAHIEMMNNVDVYSLSKACKATIEREKPEWVKVDVVGIGAGVADNLRGWGFTNIIDYISQERPWSPEKHVNRRTESWYNLREKFRKDEINLPDDDTLLGQLTAPKYKFDSAGRYVLESKEDMKKRGLTSPDRADVIAMLFENDDEYDSAIAKDYAGTADTVKPGTLQAILATLQEGEEEELEWHTMRLS
jgi:hypothetical protein